MKYLLIAIMCFMSFQAQAKIERSEAAKSAFKKLHPCPANGHTSGSCPGYVIDHIKALACGGADDPSNMQWQTIAEGKAKDKVERNGCDTKPQPRTATPNKLFLLYFYNKICLHALPNL
jgi:hypothetical protein